MVFPGIKITIRYDKTCHIFKKNAIFISMRRHPIAILCVTMLVLLIILGFIPLSLKSLDRLVKEQADKLIQGDTLAIDKISIQLWRGLSLSNVSYVTRKDKQPAIRVHVPTIRLSYKFLALVRGKAHIHAITIVEPEITMILPQQAYTQPQSAKTSLIPVLPLPLGKLPLDLPIDIEINKLEITNGSLTAQQKPGDKMKIQGFSLSLAASVNTLVSVTGTLHADSLWPVYPYLITGFKTYFSLSPDSLKIENAGFSTYGGKGRFSVSMRTLEPLSLDGTISLNHIVLEKVLSSVRLGEVKASGKVSVDLTLHGKGMDPNAWQGKGKFSAQDLLISGLPFQKTLATLLFLPALNHLQFDIIKTSLVLSKGKMNTPDLQGTGNVANITGSGWIGLDMQAKEQVRISFSPQLCSRLPPMVSREILIPSPGGRCDTKGEMYGPLSKLQISLDKSVKNRAAGAIIKRAGSLINKLFK